MDTDDGRLMSILNLSLMLCDMTVTLVTDLQEMQCLYYFSE